MNICTKTGKLFYPSLADARRAMRQIARKPRRRRRTKDHKDQDRQPYYCRECKGYHIGRNVLKKTWRRNERMDRTEIDAEMLDLRT